MKAIAIALCLVSAPALAAKAPAPKCVSLEKLQAKIGTDHTTASPVTRAQYRFLQGISAMNPDTPPGIPPGDNAILVRSDGGHAGYVIWTMGPLACGVMDAPAPLLKLLDQVKGDAANGEDL
jgi:hypothetical protein